MKNLGENASAGLGRSTLSPIQAHICAYFIEPRKQNLRKKKEERKSLRGELLEE
jgi:hypothetical protein